MQNASVNHVFSKGTHHSSLPKVLNSSTKTNWQYILRQLNKVGSHLSCPLIRASYWCLPTFLNMKHVIFDAHNLHMAEVNQERESNTKDLKRQTKSCNTKVHWKIDNIY